MNFRRHNDYERTLQYYFLKEQQAKAKDPKLKKTLQKRIDLCNYLNNIRYEY